MDDLYQAPVAGDFRQGDLFRATLSAWSEDPEPPALRPADHRAKKFYSIHTSDNPPNGGFRWTSAGEMIPVRAKLSLSIVLTHDCEIENSGRDRYRQLAILRPFSALQADDRLAVVEGRHFGRLYLPECAEVDLPESYIDLRMITTLRQRGLDLDKRILSLSDYGRDALQTAILRYFTEQSLA